MKKVRIDVDVRKALEILGGSVFAGPEATIRELVANAADGLAALPIEQRRGGQIRLAPILKGGDDARVLRIIDTGIGMTTDEAKGYLGRLFYSGKENQVDAIGKFGIGFYSCLPLCRSVEVLTRSRNVDDPGTRLVYAGGAEMDVGSYPVENPGTTVTLHLLRDHKRLTEAATLKEIVRRYCNYVRFPIFLNDDLLNDMDAPWYHKEAPEEQIRAVLSKAFGLRDPLVLLPLQLEAGPGSRIQGVLYLSDAQESPSVHLFSRRVLITARDEAILGVELRPFLGGVIDIEQLPLVISRDAVVTHSAQIRRIRTVLVDFLSESLAELAVRRRQDFRRIMASHGPAIKQACLQHPTMLARLREHFSFRSSVRERVTVFEYLATAADPVVIYADDLGQAAPLLPVYQRVNTEVLYMTDAVDRELRKDWQIGPRTITFRRVDVAPPGERTASADQRAKVGEKALEPTILEMVQQVFRLAVDPKIFIEVRPLGDGGPPAVLTLPDETRRHVTAAAALRRYEREGLLHELSDEMRRIVEGGGLDALEELTGQSLLLNHSNDIVQQLLGRLQDEHARWRNGSARAKPETAALRPLIAKFLYDQALLSSGLPLLPRKLAEISQNHTALIAALLRQIAQ